jgi:hypothetical protein
MKAILCIGVCLFLGAYGMKIYYDIQFLDCHDFSTKHTVWKGFLARDSGNDVRCFWLEQSYPYRTRQGVPVQ